MRRAPRRVVSVEPFFMELLSGIEDTLAPLGRSVLLAIVADEESERLMYQRWADSGVVDSVLFMDLLEDDPRPALLAGLGLPAVAIGRWEAPGLSCVAADEAHAMGLVATHLLNFGHTNLAHVTGPTAYRHTKVRAEALAALCAERGSNLVTVAGDYSAEAGEYLTRGILAAPGARPTAVIYDNDVMAVAGLHVAHELGLDVPRDVSLVGWDDSPLCRLTQPPLTTTTVDVHALGGTAARALLAVLDGEPPRSRAADQAVLTIRGTTAVAATELPANPSPPARTEPRADSAGVQPG